MKRLFEESGISIRLIKFKGFLEMGSDDDGDVCVFILLLYLSIEHKPIRVVGFDIDKNQIGPDDPE